MSVSPPWLQVTWTIARNKGILYCYWHVVRGLHYGRASRQRTTVQWKNGVWTARQGTPFVLCMLSMHVSQCIFFYVADSYSCRYRYVFNDSLWWSYFSCRYLEHLAHLMRRYGLVMPSYLVSKSTLLNNRMFLIPAFVVSPPSVYDCMIASYFDFFSSGTTD